MCKIYFNLSHRCLKTVEPEMIVLVSNKQSYDGTTDPAPWAGIGGACPPTESAVPTLD